MCVRRSDWDHSQRVCRPFHPPADLWRGCVADVSPKGQTGRVRGQKVGAWGPAPTRAASGPEATNARVCRKVHSAPIAPNAVFQQLDPKARPQIGEPTLVASTAAQALVPLTPSPPPVGNGAPPLRPHSAGHSGFIMASPPSLFPFQFTATKDVLLTARGATKRSGELRFIRICQDSSLT